MVTVATDLNFTAERVKSIRDELNLTQQAFADKLGVKQSTVSGWEQGLRTPNGPAVIAALLDAEREASEAA
jgi:putative transcriptional regulator